MSVDAPSSCFAASTSATWTSFVKNVVVGPPSTPATCACRRRRRGGSEEGARGLVEAAGSAVRARGRQSPTMPGAQLVDWIAVPRPPVRPKPTLIITHVLPTRPAESNEPTIGALFSMRHVAT